jgi:hypothetical protein
MEQTLKIYEKVNYKMTSSLINRNMRELHIQYRKLTIQKDLFKIDLVDRLFICLALLQGSFIEIEMRFTRFDGL